MAFWQSNRSALDRVSAETGVPAHIIVAIIGVETYYGRITGSYRVVDALSTLAFRYPPAPDRASDGDLGASGAVKSFFGDSSGTSGGVVDGLPGERASYSSAPLAVAGRTLNDLCAGTGETLARM